MFAHLTGIKHRTKYIGMRLGVRTAAMDGASAQEKARDLESEDGLRIDLLKTIFSDNRYPWPAGKSPWAAEAANIAGGGGVGRHVTARSLCGCGGWGGRRRRRRRWRGRMRR